MFANDPPEPALARVSVFSSTRARVSARAPARRGDARGARRPQTPEPNETRDETAGDATWPQPLVVVTPTRVAPARARARTRARAGRPPPARARRSRTSSPETASRARALKDTEQRREAKCARHVVPSARHQDRWRVRHSSAARAAPAPSTWTALSTLRPASGVQARALQTRVRSTLKGTRATRKQKYRLQPRPTFLLKGSYFYNRLIYTPAPCTAAARPRDRRFAGRNTTGFGVRASRGGRNPRASSASARTRCHRRGRRRPTTGTPPRLPGGPPRDAETRRHRRRARRLRRVPTLERRQPRLQRGVLRRPRPSLPRDVRVRLAPPRAHGPRRRKKLRADGRRRGGGGTRRRRGARSRRRARRVLSALVAGVRGRRRHRRQGRGGVARHRRLRGVPPGIVARTQRPQVRGGPSPRTSRAMRTPRRSSFAARQSPTRPRDRRRRPRA